MRLCSNEILQNRKVYLKKNVCRLFHLVPVLYPAANKCTCNVILPLLEFMKVHSHLSPAVSLSHSLRCREKSHHQLYLFLIPGEVKGSMKPHLREKRAAIFCFQLTGKSERMQRHWGGRTNSVSSSAVARWAWRRMNTWTGASLMCCWIDGAVCSTFFLLSTNKNINNLYCFSGNTHTLCSVKTHHLLCNTLWVWHRPFVAVYQPRVCHSVVIFLLFGPGAAIFRWICIVYHGRFQF